MARKTRTNTGTVEMTARPRQITPALATQWIERDVDVRAKDEQAESVEDDTKKRGVRDARVALYAGIMARGEWLLNGESIVLALDGRILNGNHRLWAVVASGITIWSLVAVGAEKGSYQTFDQGWNRDASQVLAMKHEINTSALSAIARAQWNYAQYGTAIRGGANRTPSIIELVNFVEANPDLRVATAFATARGGSQGSRRGRGLLPRAVIGFLHFALSRKHDQETVEQFLVQVLEGFDLSEGSPVFRLRKRLIDNITAPASLRSPALTALTIVAWNARIQHKRPKFITWRDDQAFPEIA